MPSSTDAPPSPSPPPQKPIPSTPGARAQAFQNLYTKALSSTLSSITYASFSACFPLIAAQAPAALRAMHATFINRLETFAKEEFEMILKEREVVERLNRLDVLIMEGRRRKEEALSSASADSDGKTEGEIEIQGEKLWELEAKELVDARLRAVYRSQQGQLNAKIQTVQSVNAELAEGVRRQRALIEEMVRGVEGLVGDLEGAGGELELKVGELSREGREAREVVGV